MSELADIAEQIAEKEELERLRKENAELRRKLLEIERHFGPYGGPIGYFPASLAKLDPIDIVAQCRANTVRYDQGRRSFLGELFDTGLF